METINAIAFHMEESISTQSLASKLDFDVVKYEEEFLLATLGENSWIYVKSYGSVVFFNIEESIQDSFLKDLTSDNIVLSDLSSEAFTIEVKPNEEARVSFGRVQVPELSDDIIHIIALNLSQSVALDVFNSQVEELLDNTSIHAWHLQSKGHLILSQRRVNRILGKMLSVRNNIAQDLYIFQFTDVSWSQENLNKIDEYLRRDLAIVRRHEGIQFHLNVVKENLDLYMSILQHRHSSMLEWVIIVLIFIEIIHIFIK